MGFVVLNKKNLFHINGKVEARYERAPNALRFKSDFCKKNGSLNPPSPPPRFSRPPPPPPSFPKGGVCLYETPAPQHVKKYSASFVTFPPFPHFLRFLNLRPLPSPQPTAPAPPPPDFAAWSEKKRRVLVGGGELKQVRCPRGPGAQAPKPINSKFRVWIEGPPQGLRFRGCCVYVMESGAGSVV